MYRSISTLIISTTLVLIPFQGQCTSEKEIFDSLATFSKRLQTPLRPLDRSVLLEELGQYIKGLPSLDQLSKVAVNLDELVQKNQQLTIQAADSQESLRTQHQSFTELSAQMSTLQEQRDRLKSILSEKEKTLQLSTAEQQELKSQLLELNQSHKTLEDRIKAQNAARFEGEIIDPENVPPLTALLVSPKKKTPLVSPVSPQQKGRQLTFLPLGPVDEIARQLANVEKNLDTDRNLKAQNHAQFMKEVMAQFSDLSNSVDNMSHTFGIVLLAVHSQQIQIEDLKRNQSLLLGFMTAAELQQKQWELNFQSQSQQIGQLLENQQQMTLSEPLIEQEQDSCTPQPSKTFWKDWQTLPKNKVFLASAGFVGIYVAGKNVTGLWYALNQVKTDLSHYLTLILTRTSPLTPAVPEKF